MHLRSRDQRGGGADVGVGRVAVVGHRDRQVPFEESPDGRRERLAAPPTARRTDVRAGRMTLEVAIDPLSCGEVEGETAVQRCDDRLGSLHPVLVAQQAGIAPAAVGGLVLGELV